MSDIPVNIFITLRRRFFTPAGAPIPFTLRDKRNTQDDPFDEFLATDALDDIDGITCVKASGPLITPDMVLYRSSRCVGAEGLDVFGNLDCIVGIEVKKLERAEGGRVARASGLDYNTTPPCGRVRVQDATGQAVDIRGFYLFVCLEPAPIGTTGVVLTSLCLVDGNVLNDDFSLYLSVTGERRKRIGLGTYGDGADRARPMLIFANPLGVPGFDATPTLVHSNSALAETEPAVERVHSLSRSVPDGGVRRFHCYRLRTDVPADGTVAGLVDPFPTPTRDVRTRPRGKFTLPFSL